MSDASTLARDFCDYACTKLGDSLAQIEKCLALLSLEQVWRRPNEVSNAIGNLVIHLDGNVKLWILKELGGEPFERDRAAEFAQRDPLPIEKILGELRTTVERAQQVIAGQRAEHLSQRVTIQGYDVTRLEAVFHVVEHFSLHTGQIVYATKLSIDQDLSLYDAQGRRKDGRTAGTP
ncbi:MAG: DinB family protein [Planctomycetaceae bacterium]